VGHLVSFRLAKAARFETPIYETNDHAPLAVVRIARGAAGLLPLAPLGVVPSARVGYGATPAQTATRTDRLKCADSGRSLDDDGAGFDP
jgi:hypothetical protein